MKSRCLNSQWTGWIRSFRCWERNEIALEQAIGLFEEGLNLVQDLDTQLQGYENKVQELMLRHQPKESQDENL